MQSWIERTLLNSFNSIEASANVGVFSAFNMIIDL